MKEIFTTLCMALCVVAMMGQDPVITFEKTEHDFGKINESDGRVSTVFKFKNEGMAPLVLSNVRASCGCATPTWTKEPIEPGQTGSITVTYNPNGRPGRFQKTVTITSNATEPTKKVYIKGEVIPKPAKPANKYNVQMGELSLNTKLIDLGTIYSTEKKGGEVEYANLTEADHLVELATTHAYSLGNEITLNQLKPNDTGKFIFVLDAAASKMYGPTEMYAYVVLDGKPQLDDDHKITIKANIVEDFSNLTDEQKQNAPIIDVLSEQTASKIAPDKIAKFYFPIKNVGINPLQIRRLYTNEKCFTIKAPRTINSGKKGLVTVEIDTKHMEPGKYSREVTIISNDYQTPIKNVRINFTVEKNDKSSRK